MIIFFSRSVTTWIDNCTIFNSRFLCFLYPLSNLK
nr:MAG TPA: hypothetical protein [Caudoviricetes sp.]